MSYLFRINATDFFILFVILGYLLLDFLFFQTIQLECLKAVICFQQKGNIISVALLAFPTSCSLWKTTTLPPLSPVANSSPDELNSTVEIMSAATQETAQRGGRKCQCGREQSCQGSSCTKGRISKICGIDFLKTHQKMCTGKRSHMTNLQGALTYTSLVKYGLGEANG